MEIYLIRHTTPEIEKGVCYGDSDIPLKDTFFLESEKVLNAIPLNFDEVYSSPLQRCKQLAHVISEDITIDNRLKELNFGSWELKKWSDIPHDEIGIMLIICKAEAFDEVWMTAKLLYFVLLYRLL